MVKRGKPIADFIKTLEKVKKFGNGFSQKRNVSL